MGAAHVKVREVEVGLAAATAVGVSGGKGADPVVTGPKSEVNRPVSNEFFAATLK